MAEMAAVFGTGLNVWGAYNKGQAEEEAARFNADVARKNAQAARAQGIENERRIRVMARKELGAMRAGYGASGVNMEGSALDVLEDSAATAEMDAIGARRQGEQRGGAFDMEAMMEGRREKYARTGKWLGVSQALLSGGSKFAAAGGGGA